MTVDLPPDVPALIRQCAPNVAVQTLRPLISVESAKRPHAIGYKIVASDGTVYRLANQPRDSAEARRWATWMLAKGYRFDAGIAQVNAVNFQSTGLTPETMFDACSNIRAGAQVLTACYRRAQARFGHEQTALRAALSCYQSGNFQTGFATGYVAKVLAAADVSEQPAVPAVPAVSASDGPPLVREGAAPRKAGAGQHLDGAALPSELFNVSSEVPGWGSAGQADAAFPVSEPVSTTVQPKEERAKHE